MMKFKGNNLSLRMAFSKKDATVALLIPAAGNSTRMGKCKMLLRMPNGKSFLENILFHAQSFCYDKIILVVQKKHLTDVSVLVPDSLKGITTILINEFPEKERLYSIKLGLSSVAEYDYCFIHNSDNPYLNVETLSHLFEHRNTPDLITNKLINVILSSDDNARLNEVLSPFTRQIVKTEDPNILTDIDSPADYTAFIQQEKLTV